MRVVGAVVLSSWIASDAARAIRVVRRAEERDEAEEAVDVAQEEDGPVSPTVVLDIPGLGEGSKFHGSLELPAGASTDQLTFEPSEEVEEFNANLKDENATTAMSSVSGSQGATLPLQCNGAKIKIVNASVYCQGRHHSVAGYTNRVREVCDGDSECKIGYNGGIHSCAHCTNVRIDDPCPGDSSKRLHASYTCQQHSIDDLYCIQWVEHKKTQVIPHHHWWKLQLPEGHVLNEIESHHDNRLEDRNWQFTYSFATPSSFVTRHEEYWTGWNQYDQPQSAHCNVGWVMTGAESNFSHHHKDRIFRIRCGRVQPPMRRTAWAYSPETNWDSHWRVYATQSAAGRKAVFAGFRSHHSNHYEDRRFVFHAHTYCMSFSDMAGGNASAGNSSG